MIDDTALERSGDPPLRLPELVGRFRRVLPEWQFCYRCLATMLSVSVEEVRAVAEGLRAVSGQALTVFGFNSRTKAK